MYVGPGIRLHGASESSARGCSGCWRKRFIVGRDVDDEVRATRKGAALPGDAAFGTQRPGHEG